MKVSKIDGQGNHLLLECYDGNFDSLNDENLIKNFLEILPSKLKLNKISEAQVVGYNKEELESGISGMIMMAESHISIHTYPKKNFAVADVFSCKEFNVEECLRILKNRFGFKKINKKLIVREYERD
ncbi:MAG: adenosylmethionine decarboxylase [Nanoarchaeota archaeon]|nr:adenosylmethionine decarboxylase [Nanoarchaeota archaeon]|tara:strand:- start:83 stop:463 length:381 start_codon:yes stop_codon:yes gene_type:complete